MNVVLKETLSVSFTYGATRLIGMKAPYFLVASATALKVCAYGRTWLLQHWESMRPDRVNDRRNGKKFWERYPTSLFELIKGTPVGMEYRRAARYQIDVMMSQVTAAFFVIALPSAIFFNHFGIGCTLKVAALTCSSHLCAQIICDRGNFSA